MIRKILVASVALTALAVAACKPAASAHLAAGGGRAVEQPVPPPGA